MAARSWMEQSVDVGAVLSLLVHLDTHIEVAAAFRNPCASSTCVGGLATAGACIANRHQRDAT